MSDFVSCTIHVEVRDAVEFFKAALERAINVDNMSPEHAEGLLRPDGDIDLAACCQMLMDPGSSPPGCKIIESTAETSLFPNEQHV